MGLRNKSVCYQTVLLDIRLKSQTQGKHQKKHQGFVKSLSFLYIYIYLLRKELVVSWGVFFCFLVSFGKIAFFSSVVRVLVHQTERLCASIRRMQE